ncbi:MAG: c-type cytochrome [Ardenticatenales bacterium]
MRMRPTRLIAAVVSLALLIAGLIALFGGGPGSVTPKVDDAEIARTAPDYVKYCAACHGLDGHTVADSIAPNLASDDVLALASDDFLRAAIAKGRPGADGLGAKGVKMPGFAKAETGPLDDDTIDALVGYVRQWQVGPPVVLDDGYKAAGDVAAGEAVYARACASCHGQGGWGDQAPRLAGAVFQASASDDFIRQTVRRGRAGTTMRPIALAPDEEDALIAYIRTFAPTAPR